MPNHYPNLNPQKALIWRISHRDNFPWILRNGLHSRSSAQHDPNYVNIGNPELISKRATRVVPVAPRGTLNDYVPFYFTPFSPMMYNIYTGRGAVPKRNNEEICILVSSVHTVAQLGLPYVFTDRHAYTALAEFFNSQADLTKIDWPLLQSRNFARNANDPEQIERYQAEALVHQHLPVAGLLGVVCYTDTVKNDIEAQCKTTGVQLDVRALPQWYF